MERVPEAVEEAAKSGDFSAVRAWLRTVTGDVNRYVINDPCNQSRPRDDGRPRHEVPLRAGGQRRPLERAEPLAAAEALSLLTSNRTNT